MKDDRLYLIHIKDSIESIQGYTVDGREPFFGDTKTQDAVVRRLQTLAESTRRPSDSLKQKHPEVDWRNIAGFRNVAVHDYLGIDLKQVWDIVENDLAALKGNVEVMLGELED